MLNKEKKRSVLFTVVAIIAILFAAFFVSVLVFVTGRDKGYHPDPDSFVGLTKEEFLDLAFRDFPSCRRGGLYVWAWDIDAMENEGAYSSHYFRTPEEAKADSKFMKHDCWMADIQIMSFPSSFSFPRKKECIVLYFVNGKVVKTEMRYPLNE